MSAFNLLIFLSHMVIGLPFTHWAQDAAIISENPTDSIHNGENLNGIGTYFTRGETRSVIGQWFDPHHGRISEVIVKDVDSRISEAKNLSNFAAMCPGPTLL